MTTEQLIERVQSGAASITGSTMDDLGQRHLIVTDYDRGAVDHILVPTKLAEADRLYETVGYSQPSL